jgi:hypothetical protein
MQMSLKAITEEREQLGEYVKKILSQAKAEKRELSNSERQEFDAGIVRLRELKVDAELAENNQRQIIEYSRNQGQPSMYKHPSGIVYNQMNSGAPDRVLPINGVLPGEGRQRYAKFSRVGKLRAFRDEQSAFDSGMWLRTIVAKMAGQEDTRAESYCESIGMLDIVNASYETSGPAGGRSRFTTYGPHARRS